MPVLYERFVDEALDTITKIKALTPQELYREYLIKLSSENDRGDFIDKLRSKLLELQAQKEEHRLPPPELNRVYTTLIDLAKWKPLNQTNAAQTWNPLKPLKAMDLECPIACDAIPENQVLTLSTGYRFDLNQWKNPACNKDRDPMTNQPLSPYDINRVSGALEASLAGQTCSSLSLNLLTLLYGLVLLAVAGVLIYLGFFLFTLAMLTSSIIGFLACSLMAITSSLFGGMILETGSGVLINTCTKIAQDLAGFFKTLFSTATEYQQPDESDIEVLDRGLESAVQGRRRNSFVGERSSSALGASCTFDKGSDTVLYA